MGRVCGPEDSKTLLRFSMISSYIVTNELEDDSKLKIRKTQHMFQSRDVLIVRADIMLFYSLHKIVFRVLLYCV